MYVCVYIYICIYIYIFLLHIHVIQVMSIHMQALLRPPGARRATGADGRKRFSTKAYRNIVFLQKSPNIAGNLWEFARECNLGILYSSSLWGTARRRTATARLRRGALGVGTSHLRPGAQLHFFRRPILGTTTTQRGWCIEAFVSILAQLQSNKSLPGGGGA